MHNQINSNFNLPYMYSNSPYYNNQEAMSKNLSVKLEDPKQQMMNNAFYSQPPFYPMPLNYYPFTYGNLYFKKDRNMFNMPNTIDPNIINMYYQFQQQPNLYSNVASDASKYSNSNVNFKK